MIERVLLRIVETIKDFRNILFGHKIVVFMNHNNLTYETIESDSQRVQRWKILIQEFGVILLYIKGEANIVSNDFIRLTMEHHAHKLENTTLEQDTCELLCLDLLFVSDNADCFFLNIE